MPELALGLRQRFVKSGRDHIFDANKTGVGRGGIVDKALANVYKTTYQLMGSREIWRARRSIDAYLRSDANSSDLLQHTV